MLTFPHLPSVISMLLATQSPMLLIKRNASK